MKNIAILCLILNVFTCHAHAQSFLWEKAIDKVKTFTIDYHDKIFIIPKSSDQGKILIDLLSNSTIASDQTIAEKRLPLGEIINSSKNSFRLYINGNSQSSEIILSLSVVEVKNDAKLISTHTVVEEAKELNNKLFNFNMIKWNALVVKLENSQKNK
jgi:hypothetical protein